MKQEVILVPMEEAFDSSSHLNFIEWQEKINVLLRFTEEQALVDVDELFAGLQVCYFFFCHALGYFEVVAIVYAIQVYWCFRSFIFKKIVNRKQCHTSESRISIRHNLKSLHEICCFKLESYLVLKIIFELCLQIPKLSTFIEESKIVWIHIAMRYKQLVIFLWHLTLHKIRKIAYICIKVILFVMLLWFFLCNIFKFLFILKILLFFFLLRC